MAGKVQKINVLANAYLETAIEMVCVRLLTPYAKVRTVQMSGVKKVAAMIKLHGFNTTTPLTAVRSKQGITVSGIVDGEHRWTAVIRFVEDPDDDDWNTESKVPVRFFKENTPEWLLLAYAARKNR